MESGFVPGVTFLHPPQDEAGDNSESDVTRIIHVQECYMSSLTALG